MSKSITGAGRYNQANPPSSVEVALSRLNEIDHEIHNIQVQLEFPNHDKFPTVEALQRWQGSAKGALAYYRSEAAYLERWLGARGGVSGAGGPRHMSPEQYRAALQKIRLEVGRMATVIRQQYQPFYSARNKPIDRATARARKEELLPVKNRCHEFFKALKKMGSVEGVGEEKIKTLRQPLAIVYREIVDEFALIGEFFRKNPIPTPRQTSLPHSTDWCLFLISVIDRAVTTGFALNEEEKTIVEQIRTVKLKRSS